MKKYDFSNLNDTNFPIVVEQATTYHIGSILIILASFGMIFGGFVNGLPLLTSFFAVLVGIFGVYLGIMRTYVWSKVKLFEDKLILVKRNIETTIMFEDIEKIYTLNSFRQLNYQIYLTLKYGNRIILDGYSESLGKFFKKNFEEKA